MDRLRTMQSFVEVIRLGSFSEAAKTLGLSRPLVSRHITDLEKHLGVRMLTRTTRRITLTEAGAKHFEFCQRVITEIEQNEGSLKRTQKMPEGSLKILAPKSFTTLALGDAIASFAGANPYLNVSLMLDDLSFRAYDFVERGFDVAVHTTPVRNSNLVARKITHLRWLLCAAPAYLKQRESGSSRATSRAINAWCTSTQTLATASGAWAALAKCRLKFKARLLPTACCWWARLLWR